MNILLDTHVVIWFITDDSRLPAGLKEMIKNPENVCFVSLASLWEMSIKVALGRLELNESLDKIFGIIELSGFQQLPISDSHILEASRLPFHHKDPFDRLMIGQALYEKLTFMSKDAEFPKYLKRVLWE